jgi:hypothetical protein
MPLLVSGAQRKYANAPRDLQQGPSTGRQQVRVVLVGLEVWVTVAWATAEGSELSAMEVA